MSSKDVFKIHIVFIPVWTSSSCVFFKYIIKWRVTDDYRLASICLGIDVCFFELVSGQARSHSGGLILI